MSCQDDPLTKNKVETFRERDLFEIVDFCLVFVCLSKHVCCLLIFCSSNEYQSGLQRYVSWAYNKREEKRTHSTYLEAGCSYARKTLHCHISRARKVPLFWPEERLLQTVHLNTANPERCFVSNCFQGLPELFHLSETRRKRLGRRFSVAVQIDFSLSVVASRGAG